MSEKFDDVLTVLALQIFADKKVFAAEINTFIKSSTKLTLLNNSSEKLSEAKALSWFENNKARLKHKLSLPQSEFDAWIIPILRRVKETSNQEVLTHLMEMIAIADGNVHVSERALINLIKRNWID